MVPSGMHLLYIAAIGQQLDIGWWAPCRISTCASHIPITHAGCEDEAQLPFHIPFLQFRSAGGTSEGFQRALKRLVTSVTLQGETSS